MFPATRTIAAALLAAFAGAAGAAPPPPPDAQVVAALAPGGTLRIGVYPGSPTSLVRDPATGEARGVSVEVGRALAEQLGVPWTLVEFPRAAVVLDALKAGRVDFTATSATPARAADMDFSAPLLAIELGYLARPDSPLRTVADVDRPGLRIGVSQGGTSEGALGRALRQATVVPAPTLAAAADMLAAGTIDAFATNKAILHEMADRQPGSRILDGAWGKEEFAIAIPRGRDAGLSYMRAFAEYARSDGLARRAADRAGLRGTMPDGPR